MSPKLRRVAYYPFHTVHVEWGTARTRASSVILTSIMCKALNRSLGNLLFSGFGAAGGSTSGSAIEGEAKPMQASDAYYILEAASSVVVIPGYGMAVAQAQHAVHELAEILEHEGSPIYGMPIIDADRARTCFILKRSMASGFAGIDNPLFFRDNSPA